MRGLYVISSRMLPEQVKTRLLLQYKRDEPFRALHILLIRLAQMLLQDTLFHMDTVAQANQHTPHQGQQTQPVGRAKSKSEKHDEQAGIGGMTNELIWSVFYYLLIGNNRHAGSKIATKHYDGIETESETSVDQSNAEPKDENARARDGGSRKSEG